MCCLFIYTTSGSTISQNCSYIQSPNFPSTFSSSDASSLSYTIDKCANGKSSVSHTGASTHFYPETPFILMFQTCEFCEKWDSRNVNFVNFCPSVFLTLFFAKKSHNLSDVCAIRLDFETFTTQRDTVDPAVENNACADIMTITVTYHKSNSFRYQLF